MQEAAGEEILAVTDQFKWNHYFWIVSPFMEGSMKEIIGCDEKVVKYVVWKVLTAVETLHGKGIMHRDIKAENILFGKNGEINLADFGYAVKTQTDTAQVGTLESMAPEMFRPGNYNNKVDIWSLGIFAYELATKQKVFQGSSETDLINKIVNSDFPSQSGDFNDFIHECLTNDENKRPTASTLLNH